MNINEHIEYILNIFVNYETASPRLKAKILKSIIGTLRKSKEPEIIEKCWMSIEKCLEDLDGILLAEDIDELTMLSLLDALVVIKQLSEERATENNPLEGLQIDPNFLELVKSDIQ